MTKIEAIYILTISILFIGATVFRWNENRIKKLYMMWKKRQKN